MRTIVLVLLSMVFLTNHLAYSKTNRSYRYECVKIETTGFVILNVWDLNRPNKYTAHQAGKDALHALLYSGVAGENGCVTQPPFLNDPESKVKFKKIERHFFSKNGPWLRFVRDSSALEVVANKSVQNAHKVYSISVGKSELRKYLENEKIIKKLTHGF